MYLSYEERNSLKKYIGAYVVIFIFRGSSTEALEDENSIPCKVAYPDEVLQSACQIILLNTLLIKSFATYVLTSFDACLSKFESHFTREQTSYQSNS